MQFQVYFPKRAYLHDARPALGTIQTLVGLRGPTSKSNDPPMDAFANTDTDRIVDLMEERDSGQVHYRVF